MGPLGPLLAHLWPIPLGSTGSPALLLRCRGWQGQTLRIPAREVLEQGHGKQGRGLAKMGRFFGRGNHEGSYSMGNHWELMGNVSHRKSGMKIGKWMGNMVWIAHLSFKTSQKNAK